MAKAKASQLSRRMGAGREPGTAPGDLSRAELVTTIRRLGYVALRIHEVVMGRLVEQGSQQMAEHFNDWFKPLADLLVHFEMKDHDDAEF